MFTLRFKKIRVIFCLTLILLFLSNLALATPPKLNFTDLISGPATGLNDGKGSGTIITVWGQNLLDTKGSSSIIFTDSAGKLHTDMYVYYWKKADGILPGGPANLYESHYMQEIAFSIPSSASTGEGSIEVSVNGGKSNSLPFTIRAGGIYHVKNNGNDASGDGSFSKPWLTIDKALKEIDDPGSTVYVHDSLSTGQPSDHRAIYWNNGKASSGYANQFGLVAYPNSQPAAIGRSGFRNYKTAGQVVSKFSVFASECDEGPNGQPQNCATNPANQSFGIQTSAYGRAVGNTVTDREGGCVDGTQAAISGNALSGDRVSGYQMFGNEIYEYGCAGSSKLHHTTYLSIRSHDKNLQLDPWRFGWNYLHDNHTKNGIHQYDESYKGPLCGSPNGTVIINDNVIINQAGAGINLGSNCPWTNDFHVYNNIVKNAGLALDWDGIDPSTSNGPNTSAITIMDGDLMGSVYITRNTFYNWNDDDAAYDTQACLGLQGGGDNTKIYWNENVCYSEKDKPFVNYSYQGDHLMDNIIGGYNAWFYPNAASGASKAIPPTWDENPFTTDPLITFVGAKIKIAKESPLVWEGEIGDITTDIYGIPRALGVTVVGAVTARSLELSTPSIPNTLTIELIK